MSIDIFSKLSNLLKKLTNSIKNTKKIKKMQFKYVYTEKV
jgi:hypothetical protein